MSDAIKPLHVDLGLPRAYVVAGQVVTVPAYACCCCPGTHTTVHAWPVRRGLAGTALPLKRGFPNMPVPDRDLLWLAPPCGKQTTCERIEACGAWLLTSVFVPQVAPAARRAAWDRVMR